LTANNTTYPIRWTSSDVSVATVGSPEIAGTTPGLVTATGQGTVSITAYAANPDGTLVYAIANFTVSGGTPEPFTALTITPGTQTLSATGQTGQFIAIGTVGGTGLLKDVSNSAQVAWSSSIPSIATVTTYPASPAGRATGVSPGTTTITAALTNPDGTVVTATATVTVTTSAEPEPLLSITIVPSSVTIGNLEGTAQFLAFGTFSTPPTVQDITNGIYRPGFTYPTVTWISLPAPNVFPIETGGPAGATAPNETGGLITAEGSGSEDVIVEATNPDKTVVYSSSPAVFNCPLVLASTDPQTGAITPGSCNPDTIANPLLVTLTVFNAGLNPDGWLITAASATGTPDVIHCGPGSSSGGSVCAATYPVGTTVTLTAPAESGVNFGGWSSNCLGNPVIPVQNETNTCTVTLGANGSSNVAVGAIFN
jgi:flavin reductase (DIM6/NTAB) family NADH-FMN oxidoreductase RutF